MININRKQKQKRESCVLREQTVREKGETRRRRRRREKRER
jgi:hypothetical protein